MSNYLDTADSGSDEDEKVGIVTSPEEKEFALQECARIKGEGNDHFSKSEFQEALTKYSEALTTLKNANLPKDALILLNRCASYLALKRFVPALNDANQAIALDPLNWKGYWRQGVALMSMTKKSFRTKQAIEAFEKCSKCATLPANKQSEVQNELNKARARMARQDEETPPADLSNCAPS